MRRLAVSTTALILAMTMALPALASHTHVRQTGNGACVVLAANGGEDEVQLPHADQFDLTRRHPLHVNVHLGQAGTRQGEAVVWVAGSAGDLANCDGYVNE